MGNGGIKRLSKNTTEIRIKAKPNNENNWLSLWEIGLKYDLYSKSNWIKPTLSNDMIVYKTPEKLQLIIPKFVQWVDKMMQKDVEKKIDIFELVSMEDCLPIVQEIN